MRRFRLNIIKDLLPACLMNSEAETKKCFLDLKTSITFIYILHLQACKVYFINFLKTKTTGHLTLHFCTLERSSTKMNMTWSHVGIYQFMRYGFQVFDILLKCILLLLQRFMCYTSIA